MEKPQRSVDELSSLLSDRLCDELGGGIRCPLLYREPSELANWSAERTDDAKVVAVVERLQREYDAL
jgi:hypothetical protein